MSRVGRTQAVEKHLAPLRLLRLLSPLCLLCLGAGTFVAAQARPAAPPCVVSGTVTSGGTALPGVSIVLSQSGAVAAASSTDENGVYRVRVSPGEYGVSAQMAAFAPHQGTVTVDGRLRHLRRDARLHPHGSRLRLAQLRRQAAAPAGPIIEAPGLTRRPPRLGGRGQAGAQGDGGQRFAALQVLQAESAGRGLGFGRRRRSAIRRRACCRPASRRARPPTSSR